MLSTTCNSGTMIQVKRNVDQYTNIQKVSMTGELGSPGRDCATSMGRSSVPANPSSLAEQRQNDRLTACGTYKHENGRNVDRDTHHVTCTDAMYTMDIPRRAK